MSGPVVPERQVRAFDKAMAVRLGFDAEEIVDDFYANFTTDGDMTRVTFTGTAYLPTDEVLAMFNGEPL